MEEFDFRENIKTYLNKLEDLLLDGIDLDLDLDDFVSKINNVKDALDDGIIRIVLLGSFSDGKTSVLAGLLGRLEDTMKIDNDESSDELTVYRPAGLKEGFEIVDTPGLFGTKEKEINGKCIRFSEITEQYMSEAHIIVYVSNAVNPIKDSHIDIIKRVLRDFDKLDNTIFVLNKMDEAGYNLRDDFDFYRGVDIKRENIITRLRNTINLTPDEERKLNIACISADPKGKGLPFWFTRSDEYLKRSRIDVLRNCINNIVDKNNQLELQRSTSFVSVTDMVENLSKLISETSSPFKNGIAEMENQMQDLASELKNAKEDLSQSRLNIKKDLRTLSKEILMDIESSSIETIDGIISNEIGEQNGKVTFYMFNDSVQTIITSFAEDNRVRLDNVSIKFEKTFKIQEKILNEILELGSEGLKNTKISISGEQLKSLRDVVAKDYKFKPWGAIKKAEKLTKTLGVAVAGISVLIELRKFYKRYKEEKEFKKLKTDLKNVINNQITLYLKTLETDDSFYDNYAPSYLKLKNALENRMIEIESLKQRMKKLNGYKQRLDLFYKSNIEDVEFEEL